MLQRHCHLDCESDSTVCCVTERVERELRPHVAVVARARWKRKAQGVCTRCRVVAWMRTCADEGALLRSSKEESFCGRTIRNFLVALP